MPASPQTAPASIPSTITQPSPSPDPAVTSAPAIPSVLKSATTPSANQSPIDGGVFTFGPMEASLHHLAGGGVPKLEDISINSMDEATVDIPNSLRAILDELNLVAFRFGYDGLMSNPLVSSQIAVPLTPVSVPRAAVYCGRDGFMRMGDLIVCVADKAVLKKVVIDPQRERIKRSNDAIANSEMVEAHGGKGGVIEGRATIRREATGKPGSSVTLKEALTSF